MALKFCLYWDGRGPGTLYHRACTWTTISSSCRIQRNTKGLKITAQHVHFGKFLNKKIQKGQNPNCHFWDARSKCKKLHVTPAPALPPKGWVDHPSQPFSQSTIHPYPRLIQGTSPPQASLIPHQGASKETSCLFSLPWAVTPVPISCPCLILSSGLLTISVD